MRAGTVAGAGAGGDDAGQGRRPGCTCAFGRDAPQPHMTRPPAEEDPQNRIVAVTLDEESIGRSGPDIEHERAIAIYDLVEKNLFAPEGAGPGPFALHIAITGNRLMFDVRREDGTPDKIEAIDMGRRGIHDEGSRTLMERLHGKVRIDFETARRLFTLISVLHWKG